MFDKVPFMGFLVFKSLYVLQYITTKKHFKITYQKYIVSLNITYIFLNQKQLMKVT